MNEPHEATAPKSSRGRGGREKPRFSLPGLVATGFRRFMRLVLSDAEKCSRKTSGTMVLKYHAMHVLEIAANLLIN